MENNLKSTLNSALSHLPTDKKESMMRTNFATDVSKQLPFPARSRYDDLARFLYLVLIALIFSTGLSAQSDTRYTEGDVNDNAQMSLAVPLGSYHGRGLDLPVSLSYSSDVWTSDYLNSVEACITGYGCGFPAGVVQEVFSKNAVAGWKSSLQLPIIEFPKQRSIYSDKGMTSGGGWNYRVAEVYIHMPDGSTHTLRKSDQPYQGNVDMNGTFYAVDGSRIRFDANGTSYSGTIYMPDGTRYVLGLSSSQIIDRNGNTLNYDASTHTWTDTLGRQIVDPIPSAPLAQDYDYYLPGLAGVNNGLQKYTFRWKHLSDALTPDENDNTPSLKYVADKYLPSPSLSPTSYNQGNFPQAQSTQYQSIFHSDGTTYDEFGNPSTGSLSLGAGQAGGQLFDPIVLAEIVLPDQTSYKFTYDPSGKINKVVYPTNSYESYEYDSGGAAYSGASGRILSRKESIDGLGDDSREWTYTLISGNLAIISPDRTRTEIEKYDAGPQTWIQIGPGNQTLVSLYPFGFQDSRQYVVKKRKFYSTSVDGLGGTLLREEVNEFDETTQNHTVGTTTFPVSRNPRLSRSTTIVFEGSGDALAQSTTFSYDLTNQYTTGVDQTSSSTYKYVVVSNSVGQGGDLSQISLGTLAKTTETTYLNNSTLSSANILGLPTSVQIKDASGTVVSRSEMTYDDSTFVPTGVVRGLPTTMRTWDNTKGAYTNSSAYLVTHATFDSYGNRAIATDAMGNETTTTYDSTYHTFPVSVTSPVPDSSGVHGSTSAFTSSTSFDPTTGLVLSTTDANGQATTMEYNDPLLRPTKVTAPNGQQTTTEYGPPDSNNVLSESQRWVRVRTQIDSDHWSESKSFYDGIGRTYKSQKTDSADTQGDIYTLTCYDIIGRVQKTTNPFRNLTTESCSTTTGLKWTAPQYDDLSRTTKVTAPDTTDVQITYGLSTTGMIGTTKTITDQAGRSREGITDALGNMIEVIEDPSGTPLVTDYIFDTLGNLRKTTQGDQTRFFTYDSLGRVLRAKQIEQDVNSALALTTVDPITGNNSWTVGYGYDDNGNITSTTDARGLTINAYYDHLNRLYYRDYSDTAMPDVSFYYDGIYHDASNTLHTATGSAKGKTTEISSSVSRSINTAFDSMGRLLNSQQNTEGQAYPFQYNYNLSGALISETYPSGRVVQNTLDSDGKLEQVQSRKDSNHGFWTYANSFSYDPTGAVTKMQLGNGRWETAEYNDREQVTKIGLGTLDSNASLLELDFGYTGSDPTNTVGDRNNGSMRSQTIKVPAVGSNAAFEADQTYSYDPLNRIASATEAVSSTQTWKQEFSYDRYGNRNFVTGTGHTTTLGSCSSAVCNPTVSTVNNRFSSGQDYVYDADGDVTKDATGQRFDYDSENRQIAFYTSGNTINPPDATYFYDGNGQRVKKISATETTFFVYDAGGKLAAEYSTQISSIPRVNYMTMDHLGSPRITTDQNGAIISRKDFTPFGETITSSQRLSDTGGNGYDLPNVRQDFTGYQDDNETGLEYSMARYYNAGHGRFTSPDPLTASASIRNPQTLNRYSYVTNSPYKFVDPMGLTLMDAGIYLTTDPNLAGELDRVWAQMFRTASDTIRHQTETVGAAGKGAATTQESPPPQPSADQNAGAEQGTKRPLYIFISAEPEEMQVRSADGRKVIDPAPDFSNLQAPNNMLIIVYTKNDKNYYGYDGFAKGAFEDAVQDANSIGVIVIGHGGGVYNEKGVFVATELPIGAGYSYSPFEPLENPKSHTPVIVALGCDTKDLGQLLRSAVSNGTIIALDSGSDGVSSVNGIAHAGYAAAQALLKGQTPDAVVRQSNAAFVKSVQATPKYNKDPSYNGDHVVRIQ